MTTITLPPDDLTPPETPDEERASRHPFEKHENGSGRTERNEEHRGFILWAAQDEGQRSVRLVARAIGRNEATVRKWRENFRWAERVADAGKGGQAMALGIYRRDYLSSRGRLELEVVRRNISVSIIPGDPVDIPMPESVAEGSFNLETGKGRPGNPEGATKRVESRKNKELDIIRRGILLYDGALAQFARDLTANKVSVRPRDVPFLLQARRKLLRDEDLIEHGGEVESRRIVIPESYRVKQARASGADVIAALADDVEDLGIILRALVNQRTENAMREATPGEATISE